MIASSELEAQGKLITMRKSKRLYYPASGQRA
jgi:hypothetical protein